MKANLESAKVHTSQIFEAIPKRQWMRSEYDGKELRNDDLKSLKSTGRCNAVNILLVMAQVRTNLNPFTKVVLSSLRSLTDQDKSFYDQIVI
jgi:hypothetical protein